MLATGIAVKANEQLLRGVDTLGTGAAGRFPPMAPAGDADLFGADT